MNGHEDERHGEGRRVPDYDPIEILELQYAARELEDEVIGRYLSDPTNMRQIRRILQMAFDNLEILPRGDGWECPPGWLHVNCRCKRRVGPTPGDSEPLPPIPPGPEDF